MLRQLPAVLGLCLAIPAARAGDTPSLAWISGHWCTESGATTVEELWLPPQGGVAIGLGRTYMQDRTTGFEYLRIVDVGGVPTYVAQPGGRPPTDFRMTASGEQWIRFENPSHDFPQRIEYRREGDALHAETAGPGENGEEVVISFDYRRCGARQP